MATLDFSPQSFSYGTEGWSFGSQAFNTDSAFAVSSSGALGTLNLYNFGIDLPKDIEITGISIIYNAKTSSSFTGTPKFILKYFNSSSLTPVSSAKTTTTLTSGAASGSVGGSSDTWDYNIQYVDLHQNTFFGISITPEASYSFANYLDSITLRVHYTQSSYLTGTRSQFSGRLDTLYDVSNENSLIQKKFNSPDPYNQVKSEDMNLLGDAIYNTEVAILNDSNLIRAYNTSKLYVFSITVTGVVGANVRGTYINVNDQSYSPGGLTNETSTLTSIGSPIFKVPKNIICYYSSAIAWVTSGATRTPVIANATSIHLGKVGDVYRFSIGANFLPISVGSTSDYDLLANSTNAFLGYEGADAIWGYLPQGNLTCKIQAIGV